MNIVIPMAGMGKRMRPHTLTVPKPLFKIAGKSIVERLIEELFETFQSNIENIGFVVGRFGEETEMYLKELANKFNAKGHIFYQDEALGTAHAIYMAEQVLEGNTVVAFADTLFKTSSKINNLENNTIWTYAVEDPSAYGVVKFNEKDEICAFIEKPKEFVSNEAIIGIYYLNKAELLREELQYLIDNKITASGEYQLTTALENLRNKGQIFNSYKVEGWYDCGNKKESVRTNKNILINKGSEISKDVKKENTVIIDPVYIGEGVEIKNSVVGPFVSIENSSVISNSVLENSIVKNDSIVDSCVLSESIIGCNATVNGKKSVVNISDYSIVE